MGRVSPWCLLALLAFPVPNSARGNDGATGCLDLSFVELIETADEPPCSPEELRALRSLEGADRDRKLSTSRKLETQWKETVAAARDELQSLNTESSVDDGTTADRRSELHAQIADLEPRIQKEDRNREETIPDLYDVHLAKLWLVEHWPKRLQEVLHRVDSGRARDRTHGDIQDIGYRRIAKDPEKDLEPGAQAARQMTAGGQLPPEYPDAEIQSYVRELSARIAGRSDLKVPLRVAVLDEATPRAIGIPGGYLYVTSGVLRTAKTESELAAVLSVEIARISARHAARQANRSIFTKVLLPVAHVATGIFTAGLNPGAYYGIGYGMQGLDGTVDGMIRGSSARYQREADQLGIQYAWNAGYDPRGLVAFIDSLIDSGWTSLIGKEPPLQERILNMYSEVAYLPQPEAPIVNSAEFVLARRKIVENFCVISPCPAVNSIEDR